ncbi:MAG: hypothetical protein IKX40_07970 [Thermoguttaceae bacterium]|nr:hypothetical protein [Thermoguttaceae bacterium]
MQFRHGVYLARRNTKSISIGRIRSPPRYTGLYSFPHPTLFEPWNAV